WVLESGAVTRQRLIAGLVIIALAGCGGGGDDLVLPPRDTRPETTIPARTTTSTTAGTPGTTAPPVASTPWEPVTGNLAGLPSECGTVGIVSAQPGTDLVVAGVARQGLWALGGAPAEWVALGGGATVDNRPTWIQWDPADPARFWESGIYTGSAVYTTADGGNTFEQLGDIRHTDTVSVDLSDPARRTMLAGEHESPVVFKSTDGGSNWTAVPDGPTTIIGQAFAPLVLDAETYLVGTKGGAGSGVFRTTDGGDTWAQVHEGAMSSQPLVAADGSIFWILEAGGMIQSTDQGATWIDLPGRVGGSLGLVQLPDGRLAAVSGEHVVVSADEGTSWTAIGPDVPYSPLGLTYSAVRKAFYIWRLDCAEGEIPVGADNIMSMAFDGG
ncbi:MAG: hypothetical protein ABW328_21670, partial [Ilumatobacteraceae bacterium]